jgi:hypothetical protein
MTSDSPDTPNPADKEVESLTVELDEEKRRVAELEARTAALEGGGGPSDGSGRGGKKRRHHRFFVSLLLVLGFILTPITLVILYVHAEVTDTGRYVQTVKPLASDPAIQSYLADRVTTRLFEEVDVNKYVKDALPDKAQPLAGPLTTGLRSFTNEAALKLVESKQFETIWVDANRRAHATIDNVLTGKKNGTVNANSNGAVTVDLSQLAEEAKTQLEKTGISAFSKIPADKVSGNVTIFKSKDLYKVRRGVGAFNKIAYLLPFLVLALFGGAVFLSADRRRGFIRAAIVFTLGAGVVALGLAVGRGIYLDGVTSAGLPHDAAAAVYDALVRLLHTAVRAVLSFSIIVIIAAIFAGPSRLAVWFRRSVRRIVNWLGNESDKAGWRVLSAKAFFIRRKGVMRIIAALVLFLVLFRWDRPTPMVVFWLAVLLLLLLVVIEFFGREPLAEDGGAKQGDRVGQPA